MIGLTAERILTRCNFLPVDLFPTLLNTGITNETFQQSTKQDFFRHILKSMYESSGSHFFRPTTGIQSGPDAFGISRLVMTFLAILGGTEILCSFRLDIIQNLLMCCIRVV